MIFSSDQTPIQVETSNGFILKLKTMLKAPKLGLELLI